MKLALLALLALSLQANTITFSTSVGSIIPSVGVDLELTVQPDGSVTYGLADFHVTANWSLGIELATTIPSRATINSATLSFAPPSSYLTPETTWPEMTADVTSTVTDINFGENGCSGPMPAFDLTNPSGNLQFTPCPTMTAISPLFSGTAQIDVTGWTAPTATGTYENALLLGETIDYAVTVDYTPAPEMVVSDELAAPEPGFFWPVLAIFAIGAGARVKHKGIIYMLPWRPDPAPCQPPVRCRSAR